MSENLPFHSAEPALPLSAQPIQLNSGSARGAVVLNANNVQIGPSFRVLAWIALCCLVIFGGVAAALLIPEHGVPMINTGKTLLPPKNEGVVFLGDDRLVDLREALDNAQICPEFERTVKFSRSSAVSTLVLQTANVQDIVPRDRMLTIEEGTLSAPKTPGASNTPAKQVYNIIFDAGRVEPNVPQEVSFTAHFLNKYQSSEEQYFDFPVPSAVQKADFTILLPKYIKSEDIKVTSWLHGATLLPTEGTFEVHPFSGPGPNGVLVHLHIDNALAGHTHRISW